jgi:two-component system LytT family sensor kinase
MTSRVSRRRILVAGLWLGFGAVSGVQIQISMLSHHHSWLLVVGYQIAVWSLWIPVTLAIVRLLHAVPLRPFRIEALAVHGVVAAGVAFAHVAMWVALELVLKPYDFMNPDAFTPRFQSMALVQVPLELILYGIVVLGHHLDEASQRARERELEAAQLEASLAQARLRALELQTQPHFLFNTLNGIGALVRTGQQAQAIEMIDGLSELLRYALDRSGGGVVPLREEIATAVRYLEIQRLRFPERLAFDVAVGEEEGRADVPVLLLQPLVENAVQHGLGRRDAPGRITLTATRIGDALCVEVANSGRLDPAARPGIGLTNTRARLAELYGAGSRFELVERNGGVVASVTLPWSTGT